MRKRRVLFAALLVIVLFAARASADAPPETASPPFTRVAQGDRRSAPTPYSNTDEDGCFHAYSTIVDGTPYEHYDVLYDEIMFTMQPLGERNPGSDAAGSGSVSYQWVFSPLIAGETEIMVVSRYIPDGTLTCCVYHLTIDESLRCAMDWYEYGDVGENYLLPGEPDALAQ